MSVICDSVSVEVIAFSFLVYFHMGLKRSLCTRYPKQVRRRRPFPGSLTSPETVPAPALPA